MAKQNNNTKPTASGKKGKQGNRGAGKPYSKQGRNYNGALREQPKKDSKSQRVNYDNAREDKVANQIQADANSGKFNDINDFLKNPTLLKAASSFPVAPILGTNVGSANPVPGVMAFAWVPTFGNYACKPPVTVASPYDPSTSVKLTPPPIAMNQSSNSTYSFVMHANSRSYDWTAPDLNILCQAGIEVFSIITAMKRAFGFARSIREETLYRPEAVLAALGFNYDDLRNNLGQAWWDLNNLIVQTRQIWVPDVFPILNRRIEMNTNIYKDAEGEYSQLYLYVQSRYYSYDSTATKSGGGLRFVKDSTGAEFKPGVTAGYSTSGVQQNVYKWKEWVNVCQSMIDALIDSEDRGNIYGNLLAAYGSEHIIAIPEVEVDYRIEPAYSPEISMQIENTMILSRDLAPIGLVQFADKLYPVYNDGTSRTGSRTVSAARQHILNFHVTSDVTPEMILLATRFQSLGVFPAQIPLLDNKTDLPKLGRAWVPYSAGSEIVVSSVIIADPNGSTDWSSAANNMKGTMTFAGYYVATGERSSANADYWYASMAFDWHPFMTQGGAMTLTYDPGTSFITDSNITTTGAYPTDYYGDFDKYSWSEETILYQLQSTAEYSLWGVPQM